MEYSAIASIKLLSLCLINADLENSSQNFKHYGIYLTDTSSIMNQDQAVKIGCDIHYQNVTSTSRAFPNALRLLL